MSWYDTADIVKDNTQIYTINTVGIVLAENKTFVTLLQNLACNDKACHAMQILKKTIIKRTILKKAISL